MRNPTDFSIKQKKLLRFYVDLDKMSWTCFGAASYKFKGQCVALKNFMCFSDFNFFVWDEVLCNLKEPSVEFHCGTCALTEICLQNVKAFKWGYSVAALARLALLHSTILVDISLLLDCISSMRSIDN